MVNYTTQNAQKLTILISTPLGAFGASEPRAFGSRLPPPQVLPPSYAYDDTNV